jgi:hypothetical protein
MANPRADHADLVYHGSCNTQHHIDHMGSGNQMTEPGVYPNEYTTGELRALVAPTVGLTAEDINHVYIVAINHQGQAFINGCRLHAVPTFMQVIGAILTIQPFLADAEGCEDNEDQA